MCFFLFIIKLKMLELQNDEGEVLSLSVFSSNIEKELNFVNFEDIGQGVVCFTGNRPNSLPWKYNEGCELFKEFKVRLKEIIKN